MAFDLATLDAPFTALKGYDWGADAAPFKVIDAAAVAAHADKPLRDKLERELAAILAPGTSRAAKEYACRKLMMIGTAASVPALAARGDAASVPLFAKFLGGSPTIAAAAAEALGLLHTPEALAALSAADPLAGNGLGRAVVDARLACAEALLATGKRAEAEAVYQGLLDAAKGKPAAKAVELAATRGILACLDTLTASS